MEIENKQQWVNQSFANRVSISTNSEKLRIVVKAERFHLSNKILTLSLSSLLISNALLAYLFGVGFITLGIITSVITLASFVLSIGLIRAWIWHNLGEENIELNGNKLSVLRNYTVYKTKKNIIELGESTDLYTNKVDTWNWRNLQNKGMLRVSNNKNYVDFGIKLNDEEYEMLVIPIGNKIKEYKVGNGSAIAPKKVDLTVQIMQKDADIPNLEQQQAGEHGKVLNDYHKKVTDSPTNLLDNIDSRTTPGQAEK